MLIQEKEVLINTDAITHMRAQDVQNGDMKWTTLTIYLSDSYQLAFDYTHDEIKEMHKLVDKIRDAMNTQGRGLTSGQVVMY